MNIIDQKIVARPAIRTVAKVYDIIEADDVEDANSELSKAIETKQL